MSDAPVTRSDVDALIAEARALRTDSPKGDMVAIARELAAALAAERARADQAVAVIEAIKKWRAQLGDYYAGPGGIVFDFDDAVRSVVPAVSLGLHDAEVAAQAVEKVWDEAYQAGWSDCTYGHRGGTPNPYALPVEEPPC